MVVYNVNMALSFPTSPAAGDQYIAPNGITYTWNGTLGTWTSTGVSGAGGGGGGAVSSVGATAPIASSGGANPVISATLATGVQAAAGTSNVVLSTPEFTVPKDTAGMAGAVLLPKGGNYAGATSGMFRFNTTSNHVEFYDGAAWQTSVNRSGDTMTGVLTVDDPSNPGNIVIRNSATGVAIDLIGGSTSSAVIRSTSTNTNLIFSDSAITTNPTVSIASEGFANFLNKDAPTTSSATIGGTNGAGQWIGLTLKGYPYVSGAGLQASTGFQITNSAGNQTASIGPLTYLMTTASGAGAMYLDFASSNLTFSTNAGGAKYWIFQTNGDGICNNGTWISSSDAREKTDIEALISDETPANAYTNKIKNLRPVTYHRLGREYEDLEMGFIAQEVQEEFPLLIPSFVRTNSLPQDEDEEDKSEERLAMNYNGLTAPMVAAMQEMIARIESLEAELAALKGA